MPSRTLVLLQLVLLTTTVSAAPLPSESDMSSSADDASSTATFTSGSTAESRAPAAPLGRVLGAALGAGLGVTLVCALVLWLCWREGGKRQRSTSKADGKRPSGTMPAPLTARSQPRDEDKDTPQPSTARRLRLWLRGWAPLDDETASLPLQPLLPWEDARRPRSPLASRYQPPTSDTSSTRPLNRPYDAQSSRSSDYEAFSVSAASQPASYMSRETEASLYAAYEPPPSLHSRERRLSLHSVLEDEGVSLREVSSRIGYQLTPPLVTQEPRTARPLPVPIAHSADLDQVNAPDALASGLVIEDKSGM